MQIVANEEQLRHYLKNAVEIDEDKPVLVDKYIVGKEVEVDAICDGKDVFVPGIMELVERTGVHSGDSISVYPSFSISDQVKGIILEYAKKLGLGIIFADIRPDGVTYYADLISAVYKLITYVKAIAEVHIIGIGDPLTVEIYGAEGIQSFKNKVSYVPTQAVFKIALKGKFMLCTRGVYILVTAVVRIW